MKNEITIYGLRARGTSLNGYPYTMWSHKMFIQRAAALAYTAEFMALCCDESQFECLARDDIVVSVTMRELITEEE